MRTYPHRPDEAHLTKNARFTYRGVDTLVARIERSGPAVWNDMGRIALLTGWNAMALAWAEERPLDDVRRYLDLTADWCRHLTAAAPTIDVLDAPGWLWTFLIAGDHTAALDLTTRIPTQLRTTIAANTPLADQTTAVARLVDGTDPTPAIQTLRDRLDDPSTDPDLAETLTPELAMMHALAAHDPAATEAAFDTLTRRHIDRYAANGSQRRSLNGLIDMTSLMYAALATHRDLPTPTDNPYLPTALLRQS